jgi:hypothetical protein
VVVPSAVSTVARQPGLVLSATVRIRSAEASTTSTIRWVDDHRPTAGKVVDGAETCCAVASSTSRTLNAEPGLTDSSCSPALSGIGAEPHGWAVTGFPLRSAPAVVRRLRPITLPATVIPIPSPQPTVITRSGSNGRPAGRGEISTSAIPAGARLAKPSEFTSTMSVDLLIRNRIRSVRSPVSVTVPSPATSRVSQRPPRLTDTSVGAAGYVSGVTMRSLSTRCTRGSRMVSVGPELFSVDSLRLESFSPESFSPESSSPEACPPEVCVASPYPPVLPVRDVESGSLSGPAVSSDPSFPPPSESTPA